MAAYAALSNSYLSRHHALGRIIGKAVAQGNLGNALEFCFTDLGSHNHWEEADMPELHRTITDVSPDLIDSSSFKQCGSRPDLILWRKPTDTPYGSDGGRIYLVEFKVCTDSDPEQAYHKALHQHAKLKATLKRTHPHAIVDTVVILTVMSCC